MKIAIDMTSYQPHFTGGKEKAVLNLIKGLYETVHEMEILIFCYDNYSEKIRRLIPGVNIIVFKRRKCRKIFQDLFIRTFKLNKYIDDCQLLFFPIYYTGFRRFRIKTVVLPHDIQFKSNKSAFSLKTRIKDSIMYYIDFYLRDNIMAISSFDEQEIKKHYPAFSQKVKMIYNPIECRRHDRQSKRSHIIVINIAFGHKNIETVLKAYKLLENKTQLPLILVGDKAENKGVFETAEKLRLNDRVTFTGYVDEKTLDELIYDSALYVTASEYEGFGMTSVEAMMNEVPVVSSTQEALKEVTFGRAFYYEPFGDEYELARVIEKTLSDYPSDSYLQELKEKSFNTYDYRKIASQYHHFFRRIINTVFMADPMSYHNLALYDYNLIKNMQSDFSVRFFGNRLFSLDDRMEIRKIYKYSKYGTAIMKAQSYLQSQYMLYREAKKEKCRLIHMQWSRMPEADARLMTHLKKRFGIRFVYTSHDTFTHNMEKTKKKSFIKLMSLADEIIVHTEKGKQVLNDHGFKNVNVINHGLLDIRTIYQASPVEFEKKDKVVFYIIGYMEEYKRPDIQLKAWTE